MILKTGKKHESIYFNMSKYLYSERLFNTLYIELKYKYYKNLLSAK